MGDGSKKFVPRSGVSYVTDSPIELLITGEVFKSLVNKGAVYLGDNPIVLGISRDRVPAGEP